MQAELDDVKAKIDAVAKAMAALEASRLAAHAAIDSNVAALGQKIAADTAIKKP